MSNGKFMNSRKPNIAGNLISTLKIDHPGLTSVVGKG